MFRSVIIREKRVYTTTAGPLFSPSVARPRGHRAKEAMVYPIFLGNQGKRVYTIGPERRVYTIEPQTRKKKKGGSPRWWCILFSSLIILCVMVNVGGVVKTLQRSNSLSRSIFLGPLGGSLRTQKVNLGALSSCPTLGKRSVQNQDSHFGNTQRHLSPAPL